MQAEKLGPARFSEVCSKLGFTLQGSEVLQHRRVAENAGKLLSFADSLPPSYEALSVLADLSEDILRKLVETRMVTPSSEAAAIKRILRSVKYKQPIAVRDAAMPTKPPISARR